MFLITIPLKKIRQMRTILKYRANKSSLYEYNDERGTCTFYAEITTEKDVAQFVRSAMSNNITITLSRCINIKT